MAVIEARGRGYRARVRIKGFPPQSAAFERLTDARRWAQQTEAAIREGRHFKTSEAKKRRPFRSPSGGCCDQSAQRSLPKSRRGTRAWILRGLALP